MPYIKNSERQDLMDVPEIIRTPGQLNYLITGLIKDYIFSNLKLNYQVINDIIGALEGAKMEFYRRVVIPYEDKKIEENGDVY